MQNPEFRVSEDLENSTIVSDTKPRGEHAEHHSGGMDSSESTHNAVSQPQHESSVSLDSIARKTLNPYIKMLGTERRQFNARNPDDNSDAHPMEQSFTIETKALQNFQQHQSKFDHIGYREALIIFKDEIEKELEHFKHINGYNCKDHQTEIENEQARLAYIFSEHAHLHHKAAKQHWGNDDPKAKKFFAGKISFEDAKSIFKEQIDKHIQALEHSQALSHLQPREVEEFLEQERFRITLYFASQIDIGWSLVYEDFSRHKLSFDGIGSNGDSVTHFTEVTEKYSQDVDTIVEQAPTELANDDEFKKQLAFLIAVNIFFQRHKLQAIYYAQHHNQGAFSFFKQLADQSIADEPFADVIPTPPQDRSTTINLVIEGDAVAIFCPYKAGDLTPPSGSFLVSESVQARFSHHKPSGMDFFGLETGQSVTLRERITPEGILYDSLTPSSNKVVEFARNQRALPKIIPITAVLIKLTSIEKEAKYLTDDACFLNPLVDLANAIGNYALGQQHSHSFDDLCRFNTTLTLLDDIIKKKPEINIADLIKDIESNKYSSTIDKPDNINNLLYLAWQYQKQLLIKQIEKITDARHRLPWRKDILEKLRDDAEHVLEQVEKAEMQIFDAKTQQLINSEDKYAGKEFAIDTIDMMHHASEGLRETKVAFGRLDTLEKTKKPSIRDKQQAVFHTDKALNNQRQHRKHLERYANKYKKATPTWARVTGYVVGGLVGGLCIAAGIAGLVAGGLLTASAVGAPIGIPKMALSILLLGKSVSIGAAAAIWATGGLVSTAAGLGIINKSCRTQTKLSKHSFLFRDHCTRAETELQRRRDKLVPKQ